MSSVSGKSVNLEPIELTTLKATYSKGSLEHLEYSGVEACWTFESHLSSFQSRPYRQYTLTPSMQDKIERIQFGYFRPNGPDKNYVNLIAVDSGMICSYLKQTNPTLEIKQKFPRYRELLIDHPLGDLYQIWLYDDDVKTVASFLKEAFICSDKALEVLHLMNPNGN